MKLKKQLWLTPFTINNLNNIEMKRILIVTLCMMSMQMGAQEKVKIDGVATVVGDNIVLDSEIDAFAKELTDRPARHVEWRSRG